MTPKQFHFPLFFDQHEFNTFLRPFDWQCVVRSGVSPDTPEQPFLRHRASRYEDHPHPEELIIGSYEFVMVQDQRLYVWRKYEDGLHIRQYDLARLDMVAASMEEFINIKSLATGSQPHSTALTYEHFVTFIRKPDLPQKAYWHEQYVVVYLHRDMVWVIPMEEFNATGGDPMYVWPVLASLEPGTGILYGYGMRMGPFQIRLWPFVA